MIKKSLFLLTCQAMGFSHIKESSLGKGSRQRQSKTTVRLSKYSSPNYTPNNTPVPFLLPEQHHDILFF